MDYLLDTSTIIHFIKGGRVNDFLRNEIDVLNPENTMFISIVSQAELLSHIRRNPLDRKKQRWFDLLFPLCEIVQISQDVLKCYVGIDFFSRGLNATKLQGESIEKMGKNDLWIAATSASLEIPLVTVDSDFNHLHEVFINIILLSVKGKVIPISQRE